MSLSALFFSQEMCFAACLHEVVTFSSELLLCDGKGTRMSVTSSLAGFITAV